MSLHDADAAVIEAGPAPVGIGRLEAIVAGTIAGIDRSTWWVPGLRERAGAVLRGVALDRLGDAMAGFRPYKVAPVVPTAQRALHAVGLGLTGRAAVHLGLGSIADGAFAEALNLAAQTGAAVTFVVAAPQLDGAPIPTPSVAGPRALAEAHGVAVTTVDGADADAVRDAVASTPDAPHVVVCTLA